MGLLRRKKKKKVEKKLMQPWKPKKLTEKDLAALLKIKLAEERAVDRTEKQAQLLAIKKLAQLINDLMMIYCEELQLLKAIKESSGEKLQLQLLQSSHLTNESKEAWEMCIDLTRSLLQSGIKRETIIKGLEKWIISDEELREMAIDSLFGKLKSDQEVNRVLDKLWKKYEKDIKKYVQRHEFEKASQALGRFLTEADKNNIYDIEISRFLSNNESAKDLLAKLVEHGEMQSREKVSYFG